MTKHNEGASLTINEGDKVRVHGRSIAAKDWVGTEGVVTSLQGSPWGATIKVKLTKATCEKVHVGHVANLLRENLELIPVFGFTDIEQGDKIRRTRTHPAGSIEIREGVASTKGSYYWSESSDRFILAYDTDDNEDSGVVLELLERPKPKHWSEKKPVGSVGVRMHKNAPKIFRKQGPDQWEVEYILSGVRDSYSNVIIQTTFLSLEESEISWLK